MENPAGHVWPNLIGYEAAGNFSKLGSVESLAVTSDSLYVAVSFKHTDLTIIGTGTTPKGLGLLNVTTKKWMFVRGINNQDPNYVCHVLFNPN